MLFYVALSAQIRTVLDVNTTVIVHMFPSIVVLFSACTFVMSPRERDYNSRFEQAM